MKNKVLFASITLLFSGCIASKNTPVLIELTEKNPTYHLISNTDSLYTNDNLGTLDKFAWRWYNRTTVVGSGSREELLFSGKNELSFRRVNVRVHAAKTEIDTIVLSYEANLDGPVLSYGEHSTTIYASDNLLLLKAVLPAGELKWYYKNDEGEYLYDFAEDPFKVDSGSVALFRYPKYEFPNVESRTGKFYTQEDKYGITISIHDQKDSIFNSVYNQPGIYFPKASMKERVGRLSTLPGSLSQKMYLRDSL
jgi:hypothetical protein